MAVDAATTWAPFAGQDIEAPFRLLAEGLNCLARDEFAEADRLLRLGMTANADHLLINDDMQLLLDEVANKILPDQRREEDDTSSPSVVHQMLQQFELKDSINKTRH